MRNYFTLDGTDSRTFGIYINGQGVFDSPARTVEFLQVPGRDGDLISSSTRLQNGTLTYADAFIYSNFKTNLANFRAFALSTPGYRRLIDTYNPDEFRKVAFEGPLTVMPTDMLNAGQFTLTFACMPQRFLLTGETAIAYTTDGTISNPTRFASKPLLKVTTTTASASLVGIGSTAITISRQGAIYIDCDTGRAYNGGTALDGYISLNAIDFPALAPGNTNITLGTGISRVEITPRWWTV